MALQLFQTAQFQNLLQWLPCSLDQKYLYKTCNEKGIRRKLIAWCFLNFISCLSIVQGVLYREELNNCGAEDWYSVTLYFKNIYQINEKQIDNEERSYSE